MNISKLRFRMPNPPMHHARAGRLGGTRSRRVLSPDAARAMVQVREARRLFRKFHGRCFWWVPENLIVTRERVPWVATYLRRYGGRAEWRAAMRLEQLNTPAPLGIVSDSASDTCR